MKYFFANIVGITVFLVAHTVWAGGIDIARELPKTGDMKVGDEMLVSVTLKSEGTKYNALQGSVSVSDTLEITGAVTGSSLVSVWLENPSAFSSHNASFSGIVPAGYNGEQGSVVSFIITAKAPGSGSVTFSDGSLFANDSHGTQTQVKDKKLSFSINSAPTSYVPYKISVADVNPPESFTVRLLRDPNLFGGKYALVFATQDKGSGVASYDVTEGHRVFKHVQSPYLLVDQSLHERIYVQATDQAGNTVVADFVPPGTVCIGVRCFKPVFLITLAVVILVVFSYIIWRKNKQRSKK